MNAPEQQPDSRWEAELDQQLKHLPERRAPATLAPRVMAAIQARARQPWFRCTWWHWPPVAQVFSLALASVLLGGLTWLALHTDPGSLVNDMGVKAAAGLAPLAPLWSLVVSIARACALLLAQAPPLAWFGAAAFLAAMYLSCIGLGTILYRLSAQRSYP